MRVSYRHDEKMARCIKRSNIIIPCLPINCISQSRMIDVCLLNGRSIRNKTSIIKDFVIDNDIDILTLTLKNYTLMWINYNYMAVYIYCKRMSIWDLNRAHETETTVFPIPQVFSMCGADYDIKESIKDIQKTVQ